MLFEMDFRSSFWLTCRIGYAQGFFMHYFDLRTLMFVANLILIVVTIAISVFTWSGRVRERSLEFWSLGLILKALGCLGIYLRGLLPMFFTGPLANTAFFASFAMFFSGASLFVGRGSRLRLSLTLIALAFVVYCVVYSQPNYNLRVVVGSALAGVFDLAIARIWFGKGMHETRTVRKLMALLFLLDALLFFVLAGLALTGPRLEGFYAFNMASLLGVLEPILMSVCLGFGFLTLLNHQVIAEKEKLIDDLEAALGKVKTLSGLLPICASCKKIRDDHGYWHQVESYLSRHSEAMFSHGICPECIDQLYPELRKHA